MTSHQLSDYDESARTATCSVCGPGTPINRAGGTRISTRVTSHNWECRIRAKERKVDYLAGRRQPMERGERELIEPETFAERVRVLSARTSRDATFRARVLRKYGTACVVCGYDIHVEAAHVIPVSEGGSDAATNGRPLCPNHHWEYDNHIITLEVAA